MTDLVVFVLLVGVMLGLGIGIGMIGARRFDAAGRRPEPPVVTPPEPIDTGKEQGA